MIGQLKQVQLNAKLIENFAGVFLSPRYDQPVPTPPFHRVGWEAYASDHPQICLVAPREHAKSTGFTFVFILAEVCFRVSDYVILVGSTEDMAAEQLSNIREELLENEDLRAEFGIKEFEQDSKVDIIIKCDDGHRFRILARGAEQKIRGKMWKGKRPNLLVADDMEDDEQVENRDRRAKFRRWFFRAAKQALGRGGRVRVHGTILHEDSLLSRLQKNKTWKSLFFKAHLAFDDFGDILWPEAWSPARLKGRQMEFVEDGDAAGYSQEFLNDPQDNAEAYLRRQDFLPMNEADREAEKRVLAAADFAVSKNDLANRTSFSVGGVCPQNILHVIDSRTGRWDTLEWIDELFVIQKRHNPEVFFVEDGVIWKSVAPMIRNEMRERGIWINFEPVPSIKDKATRGRTLQKRMRAGGVKFDKDTDWYAGHEAELLRFTGGSQATLDDQFDADSLLAIGAERLGPVEEEDFMEEEELSIIQMNRQRRGAGRDGRSATTGY